MKNILIFISNIMIKINLLLLLINKSYIKIMNFYIKSIITLPILMINENKIDQSISIFLIFQLYVICYYFTVIVSSIN